jgi:3-deoxy-7-phosphoheptulonate synthase
MILTIKKNTSTSIVENLMEELRTFSIYSKIVCFNEKTYLCSDNDVPQRIVDNLKRAEIVSDNLLVKSNYKLVSREFKDDNSIIKIDEEEIGGNNIPIIAGPCAVESRTQLLEIADFLSSQGIKYLRGGVFKPRSSPYSFQGLREKGLEILAEAKSTYGLKIVTEVMSSDKIEVVSEVADILQIGSRNMQNYTLLESLGSSSKPILFKRGMSASVDEYLLSAEYIVSNGNPNIILCERGIKTFETSSRNTLDLNSVVILKQRSHLPVMVDPSHGTGKRNSVIPMALAGVACGGDGLTIEVHNDPDKALSDGPQSLTFDMFVELKQKVNNIANAIDRSID